MLLTLQAGILQSKKKNLSEKKDGMLLIRNFIKIQKDHYVMHLKGHEAFKMCRFTNLCHSAAITTNIAQ